MDYKQIIQESFKDISFDDLSHVYFVKSEKTPSVSAKNKTFYSEFKTHEIAQQTADRYNQYNKDKRDKWYYINEWKEKSQKAIAKGKNVHSYAQLYPDFTEPELDEHHAVKQYFEYFPWNYELLFQEFPLYSEKYKIAGTPDKIILNKSTGNLVISDWKTGGDLYKNYDNKRLNPPFQYLLDSPFNKYSLQQSHYKLMLEEKTPFKVEKLWLIWLNGKNYEQIEALDLSNDLKQYYESSGILSFSAK